MVAASQKVLAFGNQAVEGQYVVDLDSGTYVLIVCRKRSQGEISCPAVSGAELIAR